MQGSPSLVMGRETSPLGLEMVLEVSGLLALKWFINPDSQNCAILGCGGILHCGIFTASLVSAHQIPGTPPSLAETTKNVSRQSNVMGYCQLVVNP